MAVSIRSICISFPPWKTGKFFLFQHEQNTVWLKKFNNSLVVLTNYSYHNLKGSLFSDAFKNHRKTSFRWNIAF